MCKQDRITPCVSLLHFFSPTKSSEVRDAQCRLTPVYILLANLRLQCLKESFVMSIPRSPLMLLSVVYDRCHSGCSTCNNHLSDVRTLISEDLEADDIVHHFMRHKTV